MKKEKILPIIKPLVWHINEEETIFQSFGVGNRFRIEVTDNHHILTVDNYLRGKREIRIYGLKAAMDVANELVKQTLLEHLNLD